MSRKGFFDYENADIKPIEPKGNMNSSTWNLEKNNDKAINPENGDAVLICKEIQLYPQKLAKLEKSINELNNQMIEVLDEETYKQLKKNLKILQSNFEKLNESSILMYLF